MSSAVVTYCGHFFHANCLRKWLYVQETCPMCHQPVKPSASSQNQGNGEDQAPAGDRAEEGGEAGRGAPQMGNLQNRVPGFRSAQEADAAGVPGGSAHREGEELYGGTMAGDLNASNDGLDGAAVQGLRFSASGDFVGFASPVVHNVQAELSPLTETRVVKPVLSGRDGERVENGPGANEIEVQGLSSGSCRGPVEVRGGQNVTGELSLEYRRHLSTAGRPVPGEGGEVVDNDRQISKGEKTGKDETKICSNNEGRDLGFLPEASSLLDRSEKFLRTLNDGDSLAAGETDMACFGQNCEGRLSQPCQELNSVAGEVQEKSASVEQNQLHRSDAS